MIKKGREYLKEKKDKRFRDSMEMKNMVYEYTQQEMILKIILPIIIVSPWLYKVMTFFEVIDGMIINNVDFIFYIIGFCGYLFLNYVLNPYSTFMKITDKGIVKYSIKVFIGILFAPLLSTFMLNAEHYFETIIAFICVLIIEYVLQTLVIIISI